MEQKQENNWLKIYLFILNEVAYQHFIQEHFFSLYISFFFSSSDIPIYN